MRKTILGRLPVIFVVALLFASGGARLGSVHWLGDFVAMTALYYVPIAALLLLVFALKRQWRWTLLAGVLLVLNASQVLDYTRAAPAAPLADEQPIRLMVYNIYFQNQDLAGVVAEVRRHNPDIVFLMEYSDAIQAQIESAFSDYPYRLIQPSRMTMGLALFSRIPFEQTTIHRNQQTRIPVFEVEMLLNGQPFSFVGGHPWPPQPRWGELHRNQMQAIADVAAQARHPLIVAGDFNAAPWTYTMRSLAMRADVHHVRDSFDMTHTWLPSPMFGLPLDHVLVSDDWHVHRYEYGNRGGSDHLPIVIDMHVTGAWSGYSLFRIPLVDPLRCVNRSLHF